MHSFLLTARDTYAPGREQICLSLSYRNLCASVCFLSLPGSNCLWNPMQIEYFSGRVLFFPGVCAGCPLPIHWVGNHSFTTSVCYLLNHFQSLPHYHNSKWSLRILSLAAVSLPVGICNCLNHVSPAARAVNVNLLPDCQCTQVTLGHSVTRLLTCMQASTLTPQKNVTRRPLGFITHSSAEADAGYTRVCEVTRQHNVRQCCSESKNCTIHGWEFFPCPLRSQN